MKKTPAPQGDGVNAMEKTLAALALARWGLMPQKRCCRPTAMPVLLSLPLAVRAAARLRALV